MTNSTPLSTSNSTAASSDVITSRAAAPARAGRLRRGLTGLVAAASIALGGSALLAPQEAQAAGVHTQNYVHTQSSSDRDTRVRSVSPYAVTSSKPTVSSTQRQRRSA